MRKMSYYFERVHDLSLQELMKKALMKSVSIAACKLEKARAKHSPAHISDEQFLESLDGFENLQEAFGHVRAKRPQFFIDPSLKVELVSLIQKEFPQLKSQIVEEADKVCAHVFDLLGSGDVNLNKFVEEHGGRVQCGYLPWHFDFKTGYRWNQRKFYKEIEIPYGKADIKVPWELSRFQHVAVLGQAYWLTGDEKYAQELVRQIDDWIDRNPPKFGVNWACTMDVAIRVANWIWGYYFFKDSEALTDEFLIKFLKSLVTHGRYIMANLENKGQVTANHYLSDLVGLIYLGIAFPEFKEAKHWREFGIQELTKEMGKQVYDDGMDFEASTCYHRLALELFFYPALLCQLNEIELPRAFLDKLKKMFDFVLYVLKPNGRMPQIGDNDNGRLHILGKRDILDMTYLLTFATLFFDDPKYKIEEFGFAPEALWLFGPDAYERWREMPGRSVEELESKAFLNGGIYVMRHKKDYMVISCGLNGQNGNGGHAHNDKLSFELCVDGEDIIVDPGTYVYTADPEWRNKFRSTAYHNTVMIDGDEQSRFREDELFKMRRDAVVKVNRWKTNQEYDILDAEHNGYQRLKNPATHRRQILFNKTEGYWEIRDTLLGRGTHKFDLYFHFAPLEVEIDKESPLAVKVKGKGTNVAIIPLDTNDLAVDMEEGWGSYRYGEKVKASIMKYWKYAQAPAYFHYIICPYSEQINMENAAKRIRSPGVIDYLGDNPGGKGPDEALPDYGGERKA